MEGLSGPASITRAARLRAPVLVALWLLLAVESVGGMLIFFARLASGTRPGETLHVLAGLVLTLLYVAYQWRHWLRVTPFRPRLDYVMGAIAAGVMALTLLSGLWLGLDWWYARAHGASAVRYPPLLSAVHDVGSMLVLAFVGAHLGAVLTRDPRPDAR